jgi:hypothetical protein
MKKSLSDHWLSSQQGGKYMTDVLVSIAMVAPLVILFAAFVAVVLGLTVGIKKLLSGGCLRKFVGLLLFTLLLFGAFFGLMVIIR